MVKSDGYRIKISTVLSIAKKVTNLVTITIGDFYKLKHCKSGNFKKQRTLQHIINNEQFPIPV